jgi:hypothetical protein
MPSPRLVTDDRRSQKHILEIRAQPHKTPSPSSFAGLAQVRDGSPGALPAARRYALDTFACPLELFWKLEHNLTKRHPQVLSRVLPKFATDVPVPYRRRGGTRLTGSPVLWNYFGNYRVFGY